MACFYKDACRRAHRFAYGPKQHVRGFVVAGGRSEGLHGVNHIRARGQEFVDTLLFGLSSDFGVKSRMLLSGLCHVAGNKHARRGLSGQHVDGRTHTVGIGVIRVVNQ